MRFAEAHARTVIRTCQGAFQLQALSEKYLAGRASACGATVPGQLARFQGMFAGRARGAARTAVNRQTHRQAVSQWISENVCVLECEQTSEQTKSNRTIEERFEM